MGWYIDGRLSSARWDTLTDIESATLFDKFDGSGKSYGNMKGYGTSREIANFQTVGFNDCASAFQWQTLSPMQEVIAPFNLDLSGVLEGGNSYYEEASGTNDTSLPQTVAITLSEANAQTLTVSTSDATSVGSSISITYSVEAGVEGLGSATTSVTVQLSYTYTQTDTTEKSDTVTQSLSITQDFSAPPYTDFVGKLSAKIGTLPPTTYKTTAQRWYTQPLPGSQLDPTNGWYKRTEHITVTIEGQLWLLNGHEHNDIAGHDECDGDRELKTDDRSSPAAPTGDRSRLVARSIPASPPHRDRETNRRRQPRGQLARPGSPEPIRRLPIGVPSTVTHHLFAISLHYC